MRFYSWANKELSNGLLYTARVRFSLQQIRETETHARTKNHICGIAHKYKYKSNWIASIRTSTNADRMSAARANTRLPPTIVICEIIDDVTPRASTKVSHVCLRCLILPNVRPLVQICSPHCFHSVG